MKKLLILAVSVLSLISCNDKTLNKQNKVKESRIKLKEYKVINGYAYTIIEVDSVEYLTQSSGGFIKLSK